MNDLPGPLEPTSTTTIGDLYAETFVPAGPPKGVVLISHGYAEHAGRYREVAHVLVNAGWAVMTYDVRGHGHSPGPRGFVDKFEVYLRDLDMMIAAAKKLAAADAPFVLLGHSHGSLITLRALAGATPPHVTSAIISSPYLGLKLRVPGYLKLLARVASRVAPKLTQPNNIKAEQLTSDKQMQALHDADPLNFSVATTRWYTEATAAQIYVAQHADRIAVPTTWLVGAADPIADASQSKRVADRVPGATYHDLTGLRHEVFNEVDRAKVFALLVKSLPTR